MRESCRVQIKVQCECSFCGYRGLCNAKVSWQRLRQKGSDNRYLSAVSAVPLGYFVLRKDNMCCAGIMESAWQGKLGQRSAENVSCAGIMKSALRRYPPTIKMFFRLQEQRSFPIISNNFCFRGWLWLGLLLFGFPLHCFLCEMFTMCLQMCFYGV